MATTEYKRVRVWSGWARLSHAAIALSSIALLLSGWIIAESPTMAEAATEVHYLSASVLVFGLVFRVVLMFFSQQHERLSSLFPASNELGAIAQTFRFYLSFGRLQMPGWYAQNPLWKPVYLVTYIALLLLLITGVFIPETELLLGFYVPSVHMFWAQFLLWFSCLHIAATIWHDYRNETTDVSAMINGYRLFMIEREQGNESDVKVQVVKPDSLKHK